MEIIFLNGDATRPQGHGNKVIVHICNDIGKWGRGFVLAVSKRWAMPERKFKEAYASGLKSDLGDVQFVKVESDIVVANIIGQHGIRYPSDKISPAPIRYDAVQKGLEDVAKFAKKHNASVHMPRIGCDNAGGEWSEIENIIRKTLLELGVQVTVYLLKK